MGIIHKLSERGGFVYLAECYDEESKLNGWLKIGVSKHKPFQRVATLKRKGICYYAKIVEFTPAFDCWATEKMLLAMVASISIETNGEYFRPNVPVNWLLDQFFNVRDLNIAFIRKATRSE